MPHSLDRERQVAIDAVRRASALCRAVQAGLAGQALEKKDRSPVTVADFGSQALICRALADAFSADPVIAEEDAKALREPGNRETLDGVVRYVRDFVAGASEDEVCGWIDRGDVKEYSGRFWTLDPIDGTKGFLRGGQYCVALALVVDGQVELGVAGCPSLPLTPGAESPVGTLFVAVRGQGAAALPLGGDGPETPIRVHAPGDISQARFCESVESRHSSQADAARVAEKLGITRPPLRLDSQVKYGVVGRGEAQVYMRLPTPGKPYTEKIWDHAAGSLIVTEAGGTVTDINGKPLEFDHGNELVENRGVVATHGPLHEPVLRALTELGLNERRAGVQGAR